MGHPAELLAEFSHTDFRLRRMRYRGKLVQAPHRHDRTSISIILQGCVRETVGGATRVGRSLSVVCKPGGTLHEDSYGLHGAMLLQIELNSQDLFRPDTPWHWSHANACIRSFLRLACMITEEGFTEKELIEETGSVLRSLSPVKPRRRIPAWLEIARNTALSITSRQMIRVDRLASQLGFHPVYLARQFRRHYGESIRSCISRRRLQAAAVSMSETDLTLSDIAYSLGFSDQAHFSREFRRMTGLTAGKFRRLVHR